MTKVIELAKYFNKGAVKAVDGAGFDCPGGQITELLGPNGAGKITVLSSLGRLIKPLSDSALIDGRDTCHKAR